MKIIGGVERSEMSSGVSISNAYSYLAYMETNLAELSLNDDDNSLSPRPNTIQRPPLPSSISRLSLKSFKQHRHGKRLHSYTDSIGAGPAAAVIRLDFLSHLPPEIAVYILRFLHPKYLCRVVQVSRMWRCLAQYGSLRTRRLRYVQRKRDKYLRSKENIVPGQRHTTNRTPRTLTRNSLTHNTNSPLASIQSSRQRHSTAQRLQNTPQSGQMVPRGGETPVRLSLFQQHSLRQQRMGSPLLLRTPDDSGGSSCYGVHDEDSTHVYVVRRCLFPHDQSPATLSNAHQSQSKCHTLADHDGSTVRDCDLTLKKSASKRRLKRL